ncbi:MAG: DUF3604 protein [Gammaproteobacteria bacterium]|nr:DUF3604 protein [Gammaproteobacteria bacterium]
MSNRPGEFPECNRCVTVLSNSYKLICLLYLGAASGMATADETKLYWGDVHVHSNYSIDAYATGNTSVTPDMAYRFARGYPILHPSLQTKVKIDRPLDFLAVTDHAINLGIDVMLDNKDALLQATEWGRKMLEKHDQPGWQGFMRGGAQGEERAQMMKEVFSTEIRQSTWKDEIEAAEQNNMPGKFTTFIGWEWTGMNEGRNLHRCIISNADDTAAVKFIPLSMNETNKPEELWSFLEKTATETGVDFVAIPHNSNISGGLMFDMADSGGLPLTAEYARTRMRWETVVEVTQTKGTSEVRPELATTDEFAEFEIRRKLLAGAATPPSEGDYVRSALLRGLAINGSIGVNPYKFGLIGSTDNHVGISSNQESDFVGKLAMDGSLKERLQPSRPVIFPAWEMSASGLAAVWATENTRPAIFAAFKRKEVYGTTGTRISLRMFGGYSFSPQDADAKDIATVGYRNGVPMGGDLTNAPRGKAPVLLIHAAKDPEGANLDRIQVIKGWLDKTGKTHEHIYDVAWSDAREPDAAGKIPAVGNTVDVSSAMYTNTIGAAQLATVWTDPEFDPGLTAFYYARVIEIPTPTSLTL